MRVIFLTLALLFGSRECARILIYNPAAGHSHMRYMGTLGDILIEAGHEVSEIRPQLDPSLKFDSKTKPENIYNCEPDKDVVELFAESRIAGGFLSRIWYLDMGPVNMVKQAANLTKMLQKNCEHLIERTDLIEKLKKKQFDIGMSEAFDTCGHGIFEAIGLKTIISTASGNILDHQSVLLGVPRVPSYVPGGMANTLESMTILERAGNAIGSYFGAALFLGVADEQTLTFKKKFGDQFPSTRDIIGRSAIMLTNSNPFIDFPAPTIQRIVPIGGVHIKESKKLDKEWDSILNKKKQTVLISFGSVAKSFEMPDNYKQSILKMITEVPDVQFIWKYEGDDIKKEAPPNLILSKWMPQSALLSDPRLSLFVTHGGLASTTEIAFSGVPAIVIPLFADQSRNGLTLIRQGVATLFNKYDLANSDKFKAAINNMIEEKSYGEKAKQLSGLLKNTPFSPKELMLKNVEFVARFGALPQLDPYGRHLSFAQYFLLDVLLLMLLVVLSILALIIFIVRRIISKIFGSAKKKTD